MPAYSITTFGTKKQCRCLVALLFDNLAWQLIDNVENSRQIVYRKRARQSVMKMVSLAFLFTSSFKVMLAWPAIRQTHLLDYT